MVYYDRRAYDDNRTDVYLAYSLDGANHFKEVKISEQPFIPVHANLAGNYIGISASKGLIAAIWTRYDDGKPSVMSAVFGQEEVFNEDNLPRLVHSKKPGGVQPVKRKK